MDNHVITVKVKKRWLPIDICTSNMCTPASGKYKWFFDNMQSICEQIYAT